MIKKILTVIAVIILIGIVAFNFFSHQVVEEAKAIPIKELSDIELKDGEYFGEYSLSPVSVKVKSIVREGKISEIEILEHNNGLGGKAEGIIEEVVEAQSLEVDAVSGATLSSVVIKKAIENSLNN